MARPLAESPQGARPALSAGDQARLALLVTQHFDFVWRVLRRIGVSASDADDATQQVFIVLSQRLPEVRVGSERAFLFGTALNEGAHARRGRARKREDYGVELDERVDEAPSQEELLDLQRSRQTLDAILQEMPLELRVVFVLYEIEQLTSVEIAELVQIPVGTVASRLRRAREDFAARRARVEARRKFGEKADG